MLHDTDWLVLAVNQQISTRHLQRHLHHGCPSSTSTTVPTHQRSLTARRRSKPLQTFLLKLPRRSRTEQECKLNPPMRRHASSQHRFQPPTAKPADPPRRSCIESVPSQANHAHRPTRAAAQKTTADCGDIEGAALARGGRWNENDAAPLIPPRPSSGA